MKTIWELIQNLTNDNNHSTEDHLKVYALNLTRLTPMSLLLYHKSKTEEQLSYRSLEHDLVEKFTPKVDNNHPSISLKVYA